MQLISRRSLSTVAFVASLATLLVLGSVMLNASSFARNGNPATPGQGSRITLMVAPMLPNRTLKSATGYAEVDVDEGKVEITVNLPEGAELPAGTVLEGWLSTAGRKGGPGMSTASERDQKFGPAFGKKNLAMLSRDIPYALSTGLLKRKGDGNTYVGTFQIDNPLTPYNAVAVTLESDGNTGRYDPRPGSPFMSGMIK